MVGGRALLSRYYPEKLSLNSKKLSPFFPEKPRLAIVAGSGWDEVVEGELIDEFSYPSLGIPFCPR